MIKKYVLLHKDNGEIIQLSDSPPEIDGDIVRFQDGEVRGIKWDKVKIVEIESENDSLYHMQNVENNEDGLKQPAYINMQDSVISINDKIESVVIKPLDVTSLNKRFSSKEVEVLRSFLEKILQRDYPTLWDEYCVAMYKINNIKE